MNVNNTLVQILSGMPRSDVLAAIEETEPLLLEDAATDAEEVAENYFGKA